MFRKDIDRSKSHENLRSFINYQGDSTGGADTLRKMYKRQEEKLSHPSNFDQQHKTITDTNVIGHSDKSLMDPYEAREWLNNSNSSENWRQNINDRANKIKDDTLAHAQAIIEAESGDLRTILEAKVTERELTSTQASLLSEVTFRWDKVSQRDSVESKTCRSFWPQDYDSYEKKLQHGDKLQSQLMRLSVMQDEFREQVKKIKNRHDLSALDLDLRIDSEIEKTTDSLIKNIEICEVMHKEMKNRVDKLPQEIVQYYQVSEQIQKTSGDFAKLIPEYRQQLYRTETSAGCKDILRKLQDSTTKHLSNFQDHLQTLSNVWKWIDQNKNMIIWDIIDNKYLEYIDQYKKIYLK